MASPNKCGLDDAFAQGMTLVDIERFIVETLPETEWEIPIPLDDPTGPPFPLEALPDGIRKYVAAVAEETQTAPDMAATVALGTISAAAGGKYEVVLPEQGWEEPVHIQAVIAAEPGQRKTQVFRLLTAPISRYERDVQPHERGALMQWESRERAMQSALTSAEKAASRQVEGDKITDPEAVRMAAVNALQEHQASRPRVTRIIYDDVTAEAAKTALAEQGGAVAVMSAESAFLSNTAGGRYSADGQPNLDVILNGHAGDAIRVDRRNRPSETVERACLTLCLMVQPTVIRDLGKSPGFIQRGGAARLLPSFPPDLLGRRRIDVEPVPPELAAAWSTRIATIVKHKPDIRDGSYDPWALQLAGDAKAIFHAYRVWHEPQMRKDGPFSEIRDWAGKQPGAVLRIAGPFHIAQHDQPEPEPISGETLQRAITVVDYYAEHVRVMYRLMHGRSEHAKARVVLATLRQLGSPTTRRDLHRKLHNRVGFEKSADLSEPLDLLEEFGHIKRDPKTGDKGGRPSEQIHLNPYERDDTTDTTPRSPLTDIGSVGSVTDFVVIEDEDRAEHLRSTGPDHWEGMKI